MELFNFTFVFLMLAFIVIGIFSKIRIFNMFGAGIALFLIIQVAGNDSLDIASKAVLVIILLGVVAFNTWFTFWGGE